MLPPRLVWRDPRPILRLDKQEPVTVILCEPGFHEPDDEDDCTVFAYHCRTHDRPYRRGACGDGPHLIALHCARHGPENMSPQPVMLMFPEGFTPPLTDAQLARARSEE